MRRNKSAGWILMPFALLLGEARATTLSETLPTNVTQGELETAQARILILEQQVQTARLEQQLRARIVLPDGGVMEVVKGDQIPGTAKRVTEVTSTLVRLSDNSELSF